jgi:hypothetical protein
MTLVAYYILIIWQEGISDPVDILIRVDLPPRDCQSLAPFLSEYHTAYFILFGARQDCFNAGRGVFSMLKLCGPPLPILRRGEFKETIALKRAKAQL